jgi:hypothetical protein
MLWPVGTVPLWTTCIQYCMLLRTKIKNNKLIGIKKEKNYIVYIV